jgi:hypothetical protein
LRISVVTCVNDFDVYNSCVVSSFKESQGSGNPDLVAVDNTSSQWSAAEALNRGLARAVGEIVVCCHQDVVFPPDWVSRMLGQIRVVEDTDKNWGVLGTYGVSMNGKYVGRVIDPHGSPASSDLPVRVQSLDEHCLIIRKDRGLEFDEQLGGFHFYGADLCLQAMAKEMTNFAVDACVQHLSGGTVDKYFHDIKVNFCKKWTNQKSPLSVIETTCGVFQLEDSFISSLTFFFAKSRRSFRRRISKLIHTN